MHFCINDSQGGTDSFENEISQVADLNYLYKQNTLLRQTIKVLVLKKIS